MRFLQIFWLYGHRIFENVCWLIMLLIRQRSHVFVVDWSHFFQHALGTEREVNFRCDRGVESRALVVHIVRELLIAHDVLVGARLRLVERVLTIFQRLIIVLVAKLAILHIVVSSLHLTYRFFLLLLK